MLAYFSKPLLKHDQDKQKHTQGRVRANLCIILTDNANDMFYGCILPWGSDY